MDYSDAIDFMVMNGFKVELSYQAKAVDLKFSCFVTGSKPEEYAYSRGDNARSISEAVFAAYHAVRQQLEASPNG